MLNCGNQYELTLQRNPKCYSTHVHCYKKTIRSETFIGYLKPHFFILLAGTIFLWIYWPSFNSGGLTNEPDRQTRAIINTYLSLASCVVTTLVVSPLIDKKYRTSMVSLSILQQIRMIKTTWRRATNNTFRIK